MRFTDPAAWLLAGLLAVLVLLHLRERTRRPIEVPSLLLWAEIIPTPRSSRVRWNWLLVLQSVLLLALIAGLAGPYRPATNVGRVPGRTVFVLDCSASMQAREGARTRFDNARQLLAERLARLPEGDEVMLVAARHRPQVVAAPTTDRAAVLRQLAAVEPSDTRADLDAALALGRSSGASPGGPTRLELFSDVRRELLSAAWRDTVSLFPVGETDDNVAIEGIQVFQSRFDEPRAARAFVSVRNYAGREAHGWLTVQLDNATVARRGFTLAARSASGIALPPLPGPGLLHAMLEVDDALPVDNRAAAYIHPLQPIRVRVLSGDAGLRRDLQRVARSLAGLELTFDDHPDGAAPDLTIYHRLGPPLPAAGAALYIAPREGIFTSAGELQEVAVSDIASGHAALAGLRLELPARLTRAEWLTAPPGVETLITTAVGDQVAPLLMVGGGTGRRHAVLAFDLAADGLLRADNLDLLLLFLNLLDWLAPRDAGVRIVPTGTAEVIDGVPGEPRHAVDPRGARTALTPGQPVVLDTPWAGEYQVAINGTQVRVLAQLQDPLESDIGRPAAAPALVEAQTVGSVSPVHAVPEARPWLYAVGLLLLLVEWHAARRRA